MFFNRLYLFILHSGSHGAPTRNFILQSIKLDYDYISYVKVNKRYNINQFDKVRVWIF